MSGHGRCTSSWFQRWGHSRASLWSRSAPAPRGPKRAPHRDREPTAGQHCDACDDCRGSRSETGPRDRLGDPARAVDERNTRHREDGDDDPGEQNAHDEAVKESGAVASRPFRVTAQRVRNESREQGQATWIERDERARDEGHRKRRGLRGIVGEPKQRHRSAHHQSILMSERTRNGHLGRPAAKRLTGSGRTSRMSFRKRRWRCPRPRLRPHAAARTSRLAPRPRTLAATRSQVSGSP